MWTTLKSSIFAGIFIGVAGFGFLVNKPIGMFLFILGLASVVSYKLKLFTGTAGFVNTWKDILDLFIILIGNIIGCFAIAMLARYSSFTEGLQETAMSVISGRVALNCGRCGLQAIGCGLLMTTAVTFARQGKEFGNWVPLLFAVPLFIHCGFPHCIADAFYYLCVPFSSELWTWPLLLVYLCTVLGNFIGCNLYRMFIKTEN